MTLTAARKGNLAQEVVDAARAADLELRRDPYYARLLAGDVDVDEYAGWLVQLHKYVRHTVRTEDGLVAAMAARADDDPAARELLAFAREESDEEAGHDELLVGDLAALWGVDRDAARGRIERAPSAPAVVAWGSLVDLLVTRFPHGAVGAALALETIATLQSDEIRGNVLRAGRIPGVADAVSFLAAHGAEVELGHQGAGKRRAALLLDPTARSAACFYGDAAISLYKGVVRFLSERFALAEVAR